MKNHLVKIVLLTIGLIFVFNTDTKAESSAFIEDFEPNQKFIFWAFILGGFSAISLVIGSVMGLLWKPSPKLTAGFTAFGAGALLAALSVELIAPTVIEFVHSSQTQPTTGGHNMIWEFTFLIFGCIVGGILFFVLNEALNSKGGYLRKASTTISYLNHLRNKRFRRALRRFSKIKLFRSIPAAHLDHLVQHIRHTHLKQGKYLFHSGDRFKKVYFIESGQLQIIENGIAKDILSAGSIVGETAFLTHQSYQYDAMALAETKLFELSENDFAQIHDACPELQEILENASHQELMHDLGNHHAGDNDTEDWETNAAQHIHSTHYIPTQQEINEKAKKHSSAPLTIWLGIFLDGIPESFVIGAGFLLILASKASLDVVTFTEVIPYTLIAGLFLSNLPEAMSSSIGMKKMGWKPLKIITLWTSLMLMTAIGAIFGFVYGAKIPNYLQIGVEGIAAGAMLTMIAQTMIPEAVHIGGHKVTGLSTLAGYLSAVAFKILE